MEKIEAAITSEKPKYRGVIAMPFIIGNEIFEKLGTYGSSANLLVYLTTVFNLSTVSATNLVNIFGGTCNFGTLVGAFLSDAYFGKYKVLGFACISSFLDACAGPYRGNLKAAPSSCRAEESCTGPTASQIAFLFTGFALLVVGAGGIRPCNMAFGADQFNPNTASGKKGVTSFFNWYYFSYVLAIMVALTVIVYVQSDVSWALGLAIPALLMLVSCLVFFLGTRIYVKVRPQSSPLTSVVNVLVAAIKKRKLELPDQPWLSLYNHIPANSINSKIPYTTQFKFLNKAAIVTEEDQIKPDGSASNPRRLCSIQQVEEIKCVLRVLPIWAAGIIYSVTTVQLENYVVFQALQSDRRLGNINFKIPAASYVVFALLTLTIWIPIYDKIIVPKLRKLTKKEDGITMLQKIGIGMAIAVVTMLVSALVERRRRTLALTRPTLGIKLGSGAISSMSGLWFIPQMALEGLSEAFTLIGQFEFFYKQFPENMRSIGGSFIFCGAAFSSYLSSFMVSMVHRITNRAETGNWLAEDLNKGRLDYFYYLIAAMEVLNLGYFLVCAKWYKYKGTSANHLDHQQN